ncbi:hypothetical protein [Saccharibacillus sp. JS10]|uniref:hypothetical protein n=1 Tax=Saccharibacillus sp. JS10 TaxID=2950552 RepID=UPI00210BFA80|nr:hypothetical protein [Saccharibacillus sp. JS10]MCQ4085869.1 hypothetical protein [Saccharibacillus sp. JS10]
MDIEKVNSPAWSGEIKSILNDVEDGIFEKIIAQENSQLGGDWWYLKSNNEVAGLLWIMCEEDELLYKDQGEIAEISFCIRREFRSKGILNSLMEQMSDLVESNYTKATLILAIVKKTNPYLESISRTLLRNGYQRSENSGNIFLQKEIEKI